MKKFLPIITFLTLLTLSLHNKAFATVTFTDYQTPEGLTVYKEYLGKGSGTAKLSEDQPRSFYHQPDKNYNLGAVSLFIHCYDTENLGTFEPDLSKLKLAFENSGNTYTGSMCSKVNEGDQWGATWQITFLTNENLKADEWHKATLTVDDLDQERHKMWISQRETEINGLRGDAYSDGSGRYFHGPISVFFEGKAIIPSYRPIVLIHGLGGHFTDWEAGGNKYVVRQALEQMLNDDESGFEYASEWLRNFSYGYIDPINGEPYYNYQGNIIEIAKELGPVIDELSALSKENGGDGLVDIVGFSLGGLVAREYMRQNPEDIRIGKIITVATPHQGADALKLKDDVFFWFGYGGLALEELLTRSIEPLCAPGRPLDTEAFAVQQLLPGSPFLYTINEHPQNPQDGFYTLGSNIKATFTEDLFIFNAKITTKDLGDFLILPESSLNIPPVGETRTLFEDEIDLGVGDVKIEMEGLQVAKAIRQSLETDPVFKYWHLRLIQQPEVIEKVVEILKS